MKHTTLLLVLAAGVLAGACASEPDGKQPTFLTDYSKLVAADGRTARWSDREAGPYRTLMFDPIEFRIPEDHLDDAQREELRIHTEGALRGVALAAGYEVTDSPGPGVARVRIAITQVDQSEWWKKLQRVAAPAPNADPKRAPIGAPSAAANAAVTGAVGLTAEGEVLDAETRKQLGAAVRRFGRGAWMDLPPFERRAAAKAAVDKWFADTTPRLLAWRDGRAQP